MLQSKFIAMRFDIILRVKQTVKNDMACAVFKTFSKLSIEVLFFFLIKPGYWDRY